ncbi:MAG: DNA polymerase III subunit delta [Nitrospirae bacterium]|nr:DNA polymerase III subunit delta [Nitrospirota bacterium]
MSFKAFADELKKGLPERNYIFASSDPFLHAEAISGIRRLVPPDEIGFNLQVFDLLDLKEGALTFDRILDELNTVPFFSGRKFVVICNSNKLIKKDLKKLEPYLEDPSQTSTLIMLHAGPLKKETKDQFKKIKAISLDINESEVPLWLKSRAAEAGVRLSGKAVEYLIGTIGTDLGLLAAELEKCSLIGKPEITDSDISEIIEGRRTYNAFALIDAIRQKDRDKVFRIYRILQQTEEPYGLLGALNWQYSRFVADKTTSADRRYYCEVFRELNRADREIKSSGSPYPMELLLSRLLQISRR